ncbi:GNAT family N-acetyltransferase [Oscillatoria sp. FACHB-1407]|uniref:GNAT family N-acetyltransferase n=1 Tax=Oscillatoria sp. FACHB-1407 TaxID=2692847 RepID=UPI001689CC49|nr:GNAT family N-acetyltransferase [Oscillatoria sp. FACHB-1407]MBD2461037.1 GNAT family N-acetyltransferase [Oscillatoria sp. FACHB-1407]
MLMLSVSPYAGDTDLQAIADLLNYCATVDQLDQYSTPAELQLEFNDPLLDQSRDLQLWRDTTGRLIGFAQIWMPQSVTDVDGWLWFRVHPDARGSQIETDMIAWGERRLREIGRNKGVTVHLRSGCRSDQSYVIQLLEKSGFSVDRQFLTMMKSLIPPIPTPKIVEGFTLRPSQGRTDATAWVEMYNQSFVDHWNHHPLTVEEHCYWLENDPNYRPELDLVAIAPDGTFAAFCSCHIDREYNSHHGCNEGWIGRLGTRRGFRRMGLGRAMLLAGMQRLWEAGIDTVKLGVDTQNPNQALHLYESVGFRQLHMRLSYVKPLT